MRSEDSDTVVVVVEVEVGCAVVVVVAQVLSFADPDRQGWAVVLAK